MQFSTTTDDSFRSFFERYLPDASTVGILGKDLGIVFPNDAFEVRQIVVHHAVQVNSGPRFVVLLPDTSTVFIHEKDPRYCKKKRLLLCYDIFGAFQPVWLL